MNGLSINRGQRHLDRWRFFSADFFFPRSLYSLTRVNPLTRVRGTSPVRLPPPLPVPVDVTPSRPRSGTAAQTLSPFFRPWPWKIVAAITQIRTLRISRFPTNSHSRPTACALVSGHGVTGPCRSKVTAPSKYTHPADALKYSLPPRKRFYRQFSPDTKPWHRQSTRGFQ